MEASNILSIEGLTLEFPIYKGAVKALNGVTLQVASFADQQNAEKALALLRGASIGRAQLFDADVNGRRIWRLRIGPVAAASTPELAARIVGLGFGQPQRVKD